MSRLHVILEPHSSYSTCKYGKMSLVALCALELSYSQHCTLCCKLSMENRKGHLSNLDNIYITSCLQQLPCIDFSLFISLSHTSFNTLANLGTNSSFFMQQTSTTYIYQYGPMLSRLLHPVPRANPTLSAQHAVVDQRLCESWEWQLPMRSPFDLFKLYHRYT